MMHRSRTLGTGLRRAFLFAPRRASLLAAAGALCAWSPGLSAAQTQGATSSETQTGAYRFDPLFIHPDDHVHHAGCGKLERYRAMVAAGLDPLGEADAPNFDPFAPREALTDTDVLSNLLELDINPPSTAVSGSNTMVVRSTTNGLTTFTFNLRSQYTVGTVTVDGTPIAGPTSVGTYARRVTLPRAFNAGEEFTIRIPFSGNGVNVGLGSYFLGNWQGNPAAFTLSQPYYAGTWWPSKDGDFSQPGDNADKATLDIRISHPSTLSTVANGSLQSVESLGGGRSRTRWTSNYATPTYLAAFGTTVYNTWTQTWNWTSPQGQSYSMPVQFWIVPAMDSSNNRNGWNRSVQMLTTFSNLYGVYPFNAEKYGIYNFNFGGGMEHQTVSGQGGFGESLTAHELAHQWWGDWVTCRYWNDIWINEGGATYGEVLWLEFKPGSSGASARLTAINDRKPEDLSGSAYSPVTNDLNRIFSTDFSYNRGAWIYHMIRGIVGDDAFFNDVLPAIRTTYGGSALTTDQFQQTVSAVTGTDFTKFFNDWVYDGGAAAYASGFRNITVNGKRYVQVRVRQTQSTSDPTYDMPVQIRLNGVPGSPVATRRNNARTQHYTIPVAGTATSITLDPLDWILNSGKTTETFVAGAPVLLETLPEPGSTTAFLTSPSAVRLTFSEAMNLSASNFAVTRDGSPVSFTYAYDTPNNTAVLDFGAPLAGGTYAVQLTGTFTSVAAVALDGEISDPESALSLPSGNGITGGLGSFRFFVVGAPCPSDFTGDGFVDDTDFVQFAQAYEAFVVPPAAAAADLNSDGFVDDADFVEFAQAYEAFVCP